MVLVTTVRSQGECPGRGGAQERADFFAEYEEKMHSLEMAQDALNNVIDRDLIGGFDSPKEISITCPSDPYVKITDIDPDSSERGARECSIIKMSGPNFKFRFEVNCEEDD